MRPLPLMLIQPSADNPLIPDILGDPRLEDSPAGEPTVPSD